MTKRSFWLLAVCMNVLLFIACSKIPEPRYYSLELNVLQESMDIKYDVLYIRSFDASLLFNVDKFVYRTSPYEVKFDNYRRWVLSPSLLLTEIAASYFRESGLFERVTLDMPKDETGLVLFGYIFRFEEVAYETERQVIAHFDFEIHELPGRSLLLSKSIKRRMPVNGTETEDILRAMSKAVQGIFEELADEMQQIKSQTSGE